MSCLMENCPVCGGRGWVNRNAGMAPVDKKPCPVHDRLAAAEGLLKMLYEEYGYLFFPDDLREVEQYIDAHHLAGREPEEPRTGGGVMKWVGLWLQGIAGLGVVLLILALAPISLPIGIGLMMKDLGRVPGKEE